MTWANFLQSSSSAIPGSWAAPTFSRVFLSSLLCRPASLVQQKLNKSSAKSEVRNCNWVLVLL